jgi:5-methylcytosine-specific restriction endonuclease McrBC regulatory subunit McrC
VAAIWNAAATATRKDGMGMTHDSAQYWNQMNDLNRTIRSSLEPQSSQMSQMVNILADIRDTLREIARKLDES